MDQKIRTISADSGLFLLRLHAGYSICSGRLDKFPATDWFVQQVGDLGWPLPTFFANCAGAAEYIGGAFLVLGLLTRPAAMLLTITMAVAAFQLQGIRSLQTINVAQLYFWVYLMFLFTGAGGWSLDRLFSKSIDEVTNPIWPRRLLTGLLIASVMSAFAYSKTRDATQASDSEEIVSVSLAGSFNNWDLAATPLANDGAQRWSTVVEFDSASPIMFKFAGNESWNMSGGQQDEATQPFPVSGTLKMGDSASNISTYIPSAGNYRFELNLEDKSYSVKTVPE